MIYPIVKYGDAVLETPAKPVTEFNDELKKLVEDMFESMYAAHGVGLAAPQIGISKRLAVIDVTFQEDPDAKLVLANPEIIHTEGQAPAKRRMPEHSRVSRAGHARPQSNHSRPGCKRQMVREDWRRTCSREPSCMKPII